MMPVCSELLNPECVARIFVGAEREIGKGVDTVTAADCRSTERSVHVGDGNFGARDGCALLVTDGAANRRGYDLRARADSATKNKRKDREQRNDYSRIAEPFFCIEKSNLHSFTPEEIFARKKRARYPHGKQIASDSRSLSPHCIFEKGPTPKHCLT